MKILVVDDDEGNRKLLRVTLEAEGHHTVEARDGVEALAVLEREAVDGVISDILMPKMDGYRLCVEVRRNPRFSSLPFVIYTSTFTSPGDERLAREVGADGYVKKPATLQALVEALHRAAATERKQPPRVAKRQEELLLVREYSNLLVKKLEEKHRELQRQTEELQKSEARNRLLAAIVESSDDAIIGKSLDGTVLSWNDGAVKLYGYTAREMIGKSITLIVPPACLDEWRELQQRARQGEHVAGIETVRVRKDGSLVEVAFKLSPVNDVRGEIVGLSAIASDISERKALERELAARARQLSTFFTAATAGLAILDSEWRFVHINETLAATNGAPVSRHLGRTVREIIPRLAPILEPIFQKVLRSGEAVLNAEVSGETPARPGVVRHWVASYFPIAGAMNTAEGLGSIVVEITDRVRAEEQLRHSREQLRVLTAHLQSVREDERTRISREIHDELGQMLTGLKMDLRWIYRKLAQPVSAEITAAIKQKLVETGKLADDSIEAVQRIASDLRPSVLDSLGLTAALGYEVNRFSERSGIQCQALLPPALTPASQEVSTALFRILQEVLTNVARHADARTVEVRLSEQEGLLVLEVKDDGKGISADATAKPTSLGLLSLSERAAVLGGRICIQGAPARGTTVKVWIPRERADGIYDANSPR